MADTIRLSSVEGAGNWWKSLTWAKEALTNGGLQVEMSRYGIGASEPLLRVAAGEADLACTLSVAAAQAAKALGLHKNGEATSIRGLAHLIRPNQHYFNMIRADVGIGSLAEIAKKKPKLDMSIGEKEYVSGQIPEVYMVTTALSSSATSKRGAAVSKPPIRTPFRSSRRAKATH